MKELAEVQDITKVETMTSSQLLEMLHYESKSSLNKAIRKAFADKIDDSIVASSLNPNGTVDEYHLPELESKMFVARNDDAYLEQITQYWMDRQKPKTRLELAKEQVRLIENLERRELEVKELKVELDDSKMWCSIKRAEHETGKRYDWRLLKAKSVEYGLPRRDIFDANYGSVKSYSAELWLKAYDLDIATFGEA